MRQQFVDADANGDGVMDLQELTAVLRHLGDFSDAEVQDMFDAMDSDGSGSIDMDEFFKWVRGPGHSNPFQIRAEDEILAAADSDEKVNEAIANEVLATVERPESQDELQRDRETAQRDSPENPDELQRDRETAQRHSQENQDELQRDRETAQDDSTAGSAVAQMPPVVPVMEPEAAQGGREPAPDDNRPSDGRETAQDDAKMTQVVSGMEPVAEQSAGESHQDGRADALMPSEMPGAVPEAAPSGRETGQDESVDAKIPLAVIITDAEQNGGESIRQENPEVKMTSVVPTEAPAIRAESVRDENRSFRYIPAFVVCALLAVFAVVLFSALEV